MGNGRMSRDDLRRAGHGLTLTNEERPGGRRATVGACACKAWTGESTGPHAVRLREVQDAHAVHIEEVQGGPLPPLSVRQREVLAESADGRLTSGTAAQRGALLAVELVFQVGPGHWRLTHLGARVARLCKLADHEQRDRERRGELARQGLLAPEAQQ